MELSQVFLSPATTAHRLYETLRAYDMEDVPAAEAKRFGCTFGLSMDNMADSYRIFSRG